MCVYAVEDVGGVRMWGGGGEDVRARGCEGVWGEDVRG